MYFQKEVFTIYKKIIHKNLKRSEYFKTWITRILINESRKILKQKRIESNQIAVTVTYIEIDNWISYKNNQKLNNVFILNGEKRLIGENLNLNIFYNSIYEQFNNQLLTKVSDKDNKFTIHL